MKLTGQAVERFLAAPDPKVQVVLVYGPDEGLVRERVGRLIDQVVDDPRDPFRVSEISQDGLRAEPARLVDEAQALTLTGGRRVVRLRQASDQATAACRALLGLPAIAALVLVEAGDLGPGSSLRRLIEGAKNGAALPCYRDQGRDLASTVDQLLHGHGLRLDPDARTHLLGHLGADRGITQSEIAKLALYIGDQGDRADRPVGVDDVAAVIGDSAALGLDDLIDAASLGELAQLQRCLDRLLRQGEHPVRLVRSLANHLLRLEHFALQAEQGEPAERIVDRARPPIHFRRKDKVKAALRRWPSRRTRAALDALLEAELACKTTGRPAALICRAALLEIALAARAA